MNNPDRSRHRIPRRPIYTATSFATHQTIASVLRVPAAHALTLLDAVVFSANASQVHVSHSLLAAIAHARVNAMIRTMRAYAFGHGFHVPVFLHI
jgi:hypothetical protein